MNSHLVTLDAEQAAILLIALETTNALMLARSERVNPERIITDSVILQSHKIENIRLQIDRGPLARWRDLSPDQKGLFAKYCDVLAGTEDDDLAGATYDLMRQYVLTQHVAPRQHVIEGEKA